VRPIPYAGAERLRRAALLTRVRRVILAALLVTLVLAAAAEGRSPASEAPPFLPPAAGGVVVLDLSASITSDTYSRIEETLRDLVSRGGRYGLVVFSDQAYEALPPGTSASALEPIIRYFTVHPPASASEQPSFPLNPWTASFTDGTTISAGLALARSIELADGVRHPEILLISDLADAPSDVQRLIDVLSGFRATGVRLRVIALNAAPNDAAFFAGMIGSAAAVIPAALTPPRARPLSLATSAFPTQLVALAAAVLLLLALNELLLARLRYDERSHSAAS
jgi:hypothetical protein